MQKKYILENSEIVYEGTPEEIAKLQALEEESDECDYDEELSEKDWMSKIQQTESHITINANCISLRQACEETLRGLNAGKGI
ncbi:hypothetical protein [Pseudobacillus badius]|uniref:hypothetical protein n=1 Tax=Bacillus badius TaxID=1455 RepID=UPI0007B3BAD2|nr:hypothetical protein [Bacillus badius]KZR60398.1 hypothetical protein A3781_09510 [Bacillus badius]